jgi:hypothetical protein
MPTHATAIIHTYIAIAIPLLLPLLPTPGHYLEIHPAHETAMMHH